VFAQTALALVGKGRTMNTTKTQPKTAQGEPELTLEYVKIKWMPDYDPDLSWLDQTNAEMGAGFEEQSKSRKESYGETWEMLGVVAEATCSYPFESNIGTRLETFTSGGLWGIESDMDDNTRQDYENEQLADLVNHLSHFGIEVSIKDLRNAIE